MPKRIVFALQKGGTGKTASTAAVSTILAESGYRVLVVDFDSQGNLTKILTRKSIYKFSGHTIMEAIQTGNAEPFIVSINDNLDIIPAEDRLATFSRYIYTSRINHPYAVLKRLLEPVEGRYDFVFIDVGPTLGDTVINAIVYADAIIVPVALGDLEMDALVRFIEFVDETRNEGHTNAKIEGILLTMRDGRSRYEREISEGIRAEYGDLVLGPEIGRRARIKEMSAYGVDPYLEEMEGYIAVTEEIIKRYGKQRGEQKQL